MSDLKEFLIFLKSSPPSGIAILEQEDTNDILNGLSELGVKNELLVVTEESQEENFFNFLGDRLDDGMWIILEIKTRQLPDWVEKQMNNLQYNNKLVRDNMRYLFDDTTENRLLVVVSEDDLENMSTDTFLTNFGIAYRAA